MTARPPLSIPPSRPCDMNRLPMVSGLPWSVPDGVRLCALSPMCPTGLVDRYFSCENRYLLSPGSVAQDTLERPSPMRGSVPLTLPGVLAALDLDRAQKKCVGLAAERSAKQRVLSDPTGRWPGQSPARTKARGGDAASQAGWPQGPATVIDALAPRLPRTPQGGHESVSVMTVTGRGDKIVYCFGKRTGCARTPPACEAPPRGGRGAR